MTDSFLLPLRGASRTLGLGLILVAAGACSVFETREEIANEARVVVSGTTPVPLQLVTSTKFTRTFDETGTPSITLAFADTVYLDLVSPHDQRYPIKPDRGFLVRLRNPDMQPAVVSMQVYFDGELHFNHQNITLQDASLEFSYIFSNYNTIQ